MNFESFAGHFTKLSKLTVEFGALIEKYTPDMDHDTR